MIGMDIIDQLLENVGEADVDAFLLLAENKIEIEIEIGNQNNNRSVVAAGLQETKLGFMVSVKPSTFVCN